MTESNFRRGLRLLFLDINWMLVFFSSLGILISFAMGRHGTTMLIMLGVVVFFWYWRARSYFRAKTTTDWTPTIAQILKVSVCRHYSKYGEGSPYLMVFYQYRAGDAEYIREYYSCFPWTTERKYSDLAYYQQRQTMTVYYNPRRPGQVVEKPGLHESFWSPLWIGVSLFILTFVSVYWFFLLR